MSTYTIIDRRINPKGKNLSNRQRFLHRAKDWLKDKVRKRAAERDITSGDSESIIISDDGISEPVFDYNRGTGDWDRVLPGNKDYITGDRIKRPDGGGKGSGNQAGSDGDGEDDFIFTLSKDEYWDILFEDLELPDLVKRSEADAVMFSRRRSGFATSGTPNNLDLEKSLKNALGRKIALAFPLDKKIKEKRAELEEAEEIDKPRIEEELSALIKRRNAVAYIDQVDVRYKRFTQVPLPNTQAVVFCLMDVSGSMGEKEKEISKRFFLLLYLFLQKKYKTVDIVFVKHTTESKECTEAEFFYEKNNGGTIVSTGVKKINEIITDRYPLEAWNIYCVQASDGDNVSTDNGLLKTELHKLLPKCQYYVYNEVKQHSGMMGFMGSSSTDVYKTMIDVAEDHKNLSIIKIDETEKVVGAFRQIFTKRPKNGK